MVAATMLTMLGWLLGCGGLCGGLSAGLCVGQAEAAAPSGMLRLDARLDGRLVGDERLVIDPARAAEVMITVSNGSGDPVRVTTVRLTGAALGLTLFGYDTAVAFDVQPGATVTWSFPLDTAGLDLQVTGLLPAAVRLLGRTAPCSPRSAARPTCAARCGRCTACSGSPS